jgi:hypothetical protein
MVAVQHKPTARAVVEMRAQRQQLSLPAPATVLRGGAGMNREILAPGPCCRGRQIGVELRPRRVTNALRQTAIMHRAARVNVPHHRHHLLVDEAPAVLMGPGQRICPACWTALPDRPLPGPAPRPPAPPMPCSAQALEVIGQTGSTRRPRRCGCAMRSCCERGARWRKRWPTTRRWPVSGRARDKGSAGWVVGTDDARQPGLARMRIAHPQPDHGEWLRVALVQAARAAVRTKGTYQGTSNFSKSATPGR